MKAEHLYNAIGLIDDDLLEEKYVKKDRRKFGGIIAAAILASAAIITIMILPRGIDKRITPEANYYPTKHIEAISGETSPEWTKDTWDRSVDPTRYKEANILGAKYETCLVATRPENVGAEIGTVEMIGQDYFSLEIHQKLAKAYAIKGVNTKCAIAVKFNDTDQYAYSYMNTAYAPNTLGEMLTDLDFKDKVQMGVVYQEIENDTIAFEELNSEDIWEILFADTTLANEPDDKVVGNKVISISLKSQTYGIDTYPKTLTLTEDGYMWTNLLETRKCFYIGKDKVDELKKYVIQNGKGYRYIYDELDAGITGIIPE